MGYGKMRLPKLLKQGSLSLSGFSDKAKRLFAEIWREVMDSQLLTIAGSLSYTTLLAIIPALAVSFSIFQSFGGLENLHDTLEPWIIRYLAEPASEEAMATIRRFVGNIHAGALGGTGIISLILITMSMLYSAESAIHQVWKAQMRRSWFQRVAAYWMFITLGPLAGAVALGAATTQKIPVWRLVPSGVGAYLIATGFFFIVYRWVPNRSVHSKVALVSAVFTTTLWALTRLGYEFYLRQAVSYDRIYGSLGAIPILMVWIYISWLIVLGGAALGAALQRKFDL